MQHFIKFLCRVFPLAIASVSMAMAQWSYNLPYGVTEQSQVIYDLHLLIFWICVAISVIVYGVMGWSLIFHRQKEGAKAAQFAHSTKLEILWTIIPTIILIVIAIPSTTTLIRIYDTSPGDINILVTGLQWKWKYEYQEDDITFISSLSTPQDAIDGLIPRDPETYLLEVDNPIVIPINTKVRFLLTSDDVLHAFWLPELGIKKDAVPGLINISWTDIQEPGTYRGVCAELCGRNHGFMPIVIEAVQPNEYLAWVAEQKAAAVALFEVTQKEWSGAELTERGAQVYTQYCAACHLPSGAGIAGAFPELVGNPQVVDEDFSTTLNVVLNGVSGTAMQAFGAQLSAVEIAAAVTYVRSAWGNDKLIENKEPVQPSVVHERKQAAGY